MRHLLAEFTGFAEDSEIRLTKARVMFPLFLDRLDEIR